MTVSSLELLRMEAQLPRQYLALVKSIGATGNINKLLDQYEFLARRYFERRRRHHTLTHIAHCLIEFDRVAQQAKNPHAVLMAIFYHDVICDTTRDDNEEKSALYFTTIAHNILGITDEALIAETVRLIHLSKKHCPDETDIDGALFSDIDMSILGADAPEYDEYALLVRQEYPQYSDSEWARLRMEYFIDPLLAQKSIYHTAVFRASHEEYARANLMEERVRLQSQPVN